MSFTDCALNGLTFYQKLQLDEGHWACDYGGPSFLLPGLVFALYISGIPILPEWKVEITRYIANIVNEDGGWGLHLEDQTSLFATTLYYIVLRILGMSNAHPIATKARRRMLDMGMFPLLV
jgi:lanosterol synthase